MNDTHESNLDSMVLAVDLIRQGHDAVMDCDTHRTAALVMEATEGMTVVQLQRLVHQTAWVGGTLAALLPDPQRQSALAKLTTLKAGQP